MGSRDAARGGTPSRERPAEGERGVAARDGDGDGAGRMGSRAAVAAADAADAQRSRGGSGARRVGQLVVIGGGEERSPDGAVLCRFVEAAGGARARIIVCAAASSEPDEPLEDYRRIFTAMGVAEVTTEPLRDRAAAESRELVERTERATAVFFTGGDQLKLVTAIGGTAFGECVRTRLQADGLVVAGTSAGAAAMSSVMPVGGRDDGTVRRGDVELAPGLGYWRDTVVDTHFNQRGRVSRLLAIFASNPQVLGVGLDEDTAVHVELGRRLRVVGSGAALVFNGRVTHTNAAEAKPEDVLALFDSKIHVLPSGYGFDLDRMRPLRPEELA
jgi:cyanophycinase